MPSDPPSSKKALRRFFRSRRQAMDEAAYAEHSAAIVERAAVLPEVQAAQVVHAYWPRTARREVDTRPLIEALHNEGKTVVLPAVETFAPEDTPRMTHRRYAGREALRRGRWGLAEPAGGETVPPEALELVVVPAFGAGRNGHRIGHGRGYYDAFLKPLGVPTVCLVYDACLVERVPPEAHDVPVSILVTETTVLRPPGNPGNPPGNPPL